MADSTVRVVFLGDAKSLRGALRDVAAETDDLERKTKKSTDGFGALKTAMIGLGAAAALKSTIGAASDLGETVSKVGVIFGDSADEVEKFADGAAKALGQSKQQAMDAAATFATFGKSAGLSGEALVSFSTDFTGLASDLASFNNTTPEQAIEAIGAALRGEAEPMRQYGVLLDDASMRQEALKLGLISTTKDALTPQQKVLAAQALIYKQTSAAQGDFERTSDGLANKQRILSAQFKDVQAELGQKLLPVATQVVSVFSNLLGAFTALPGPVQTVVIGLAGVAAAGVGAAKVVEKFGEWKDALGPVGDRLGALASRARTAEGSLSKFGMALGALGIAGAVVGLYQLGEALTGTKINIDEVTKGTNAQLVEMMQKLEELSARGGRWSNMATEQFRSVATESFGTGARIVESMRAAGMETDKYEAILAEMAAGQKRASTDVDNTTKAVDAYAGATDDASGSLKDYEKTLKSQTDKLAESRKEWDDYTKSLKDADSAISDLTERTNSLADADAEWNESLRELTESVKDNGNAIDVHTEKGNNNRKALDDVIESAGKYLAKLWEQEGASQSFYRTSDSIRGELVKTMQSLGFSSGQIDEYLKKWDETPREIMTTVQVDRYQFDRFMSDLMRTSGRDINEAGISFGREGGNFEPVPFLGGFARGGRIPAPGGLAIVGEEGPELVQFGGSASVFPHRELLAAMRRMPGASVGGAYVAAPSITINLNAPIQSRAMADYTGQVVAAAVKRELAVSLRGAA